MIRAHVVRNMLGHDGRFMMPTKNDNIKLLRLDLGKYIGNVMFIVTKLVIIILHAQLIKAHARIVRTEHHLQLEHIIVDHDSDVSVLRVLA